MMSLSMPVLVFGFESEPNQFQDIEMTATFCSPAMVQLGSITRTVNGLAGARLFAASADPNQFVQFHGSDQFAVGALRYSAPIPEPSTWLLLGGGLLAMGLVSRRRAC